MNFEYKYQISHFFLLLNIYFHKVSLIFSQNKDINVEKMSLRVIKNMYVHGTHLRKFVEIEFQSSCETYYTFDEFNTTYYVQGNKMHVFAPKYCKTYYTCTIIQHRIRKQLPTRRLFCLFLENCQQNDVAYVGNCTFYLILIQLKKNNEKYFCMYTESI